MRFDTCLAVASGSRAPEMLIVTGAPLVVGVASRGLADAPAAIKLGAGAGAATVTTCWVMVFVVGRELNVDMYWEVSALTVMVAW
jgi:hypothetical protein